MAKKILSKKTKTTAKKVYKKGPSQGQITRGKRSKTVSFVVGVITVVVIAFIIFQYTQVNNYKTVLGAQTVSSESSK
ncbi:MAG TPA: hypothetical protein VHE53_01710 [Patescibacteria group bacterium]|nr:hypothetical protein [Patescibacteria group bacterium]